MQNVTQLSINVFLNVSVFTCFQTVFFVASPLARGVISQRGDRHAIACPSTILITTKDIENIFNERDQRSEPCSVKDNTIPLFRIVFIFYFKIFFYFWSLMQHCEICKLSAV